MQRDGKRPRQQPSWETSRSLVPASGSAKRPDDALTRDESIELAVFGRHVEAMPPQRPFDSRRRLLVAVCAVVLIAVIFGAVFATVRASGSPSASGHGTRATPTGKAPATQPLQLPLGIPTYFSFGVMNAPSNVALLDGMRTHNGTAWDYRYQYLSGGVNTGHGWETWNSPSGAFASLYMTESASHHYIPVFVYYEMLQSSGSCGGCDEAMMDLANLNTPSVMAAYLANWRLLMREIGDFGGQVMVIVEPDLWGYMQRASITGSNLPSAVPASVASSGDPDAQGLPDNGQGYALALLHIRDRYAPNAVLALHVSFWSTGSDIGSSTDPGLDVTGIAQLTTHFLLSAGMQDNPNGISTWDLLSSDVADRDSGQGAAWWDPTNTVFPNFARYLSFISAITQATGKRAVMWQVPEGNQFFDTENNSPHHTQDNRATYILGHVADFARAGVIGVLFGAGNGGTTIDDAAHDGVTNPPPITDFVCNACNTHISTYPDDDGGYLRLFVGAYYRHGPLQLANLGAWTPANPQDLGATAPPAPQGTCTGSLQVNIGNAIITPQPAHPGQQVTVTVSITTSCDATLLVAAEISNPGLRIADLVHDDVHFIAGHAQQVTISGVLPASTKPDSYQVKVGVFHAGWGPEYGWNNGAGLLLVQ